jgi:hypothetical protein
MFLTLWVGRVLAATSLVPIYGCAEHAHSNSGGKLDPNNHTLT